MINLWWQKTLSRFRKETYERMFTLPFDIFAVSIVAFLIWFIESWVKDDRTTLRIVGGLLAFLMASWLLFISCLVLVNSSAVTFIRFLVGLDRTVKMRHIVETRRCAETTFNFLQSDVSNVQDSEGVVVYEFNWKLLDLVRGIEQFALARGEFGGEKISQSVDEQLKSLSYFVTNGRQYSVEGMPEPETTLQFLIANPSTDQAVKIAAEKHLNRLLQRLIGTRDGQHLPPLAEVLDVPKPIAVPTSDSQQQLQQTMIELERAVAALRSEIKPLRARSAFTAENSHGESYREFIERLAGSFGDEPFARPPQGDDGKREAW